MKDLLQEPGFLKQALDAMPSPTLIVDPDVRILFRNAAARALAGGGRYLMRRLGEVLHCLHAAEAPDGCGRGRWCPDCVVRRSVTEALKGGKVLRERSVLEVIKDGKTSRLPVLVSVSPFAYGGRRTAILTLEDISELMELRGLIPICCVCKKVRDEDDYWVQVESYVKKHLADVRFSHGICPACARRLYPGQTVGDDGGRGA